MYFHIKFSFLYNSVYNNCYLTSGPPESPRDLGCWIYLPSKCPKQSNFKRDFKYWFSDGLYDKDSATNRDRCEIHRRQHWNTWCGVEDTFTKYIGKFFDRQLNECIGNPPKYIVKVNNRITYYRCPPLFHK